MSVAQDLKCACPSCQGRIAYPASAGGSTIQCPHCGKPVALPGAAIPPAPVAVAAQPVQANLKCACRHCNGRISFPPNAAGSVIACPHCGKETPLIAPGVSTPPPPPAPAAAAGHKAPPPPPPAAAAPVKAKTPTPPVPTEEEVQEAAPKAKGGKKIFAIVGIVLVLALAAGGAFIFMKKKGGGSSTSGGSGGGFKLLGSKEELEVVKYDLQKNEGTSLVYVTGTLRNNTAEQRTSVRVDFKLFDAAGKQIGNASDYIMIMEPKQEWAFKALVVEPSVAKVEIDKVTSSK